MTSTFQIPGKGCNGRNAAIKRVLISGWRRSIIPARFVRWCFKKFPQLRGA